MITILHRALVLLIATGMTAAAQTPAQPAGADALFVRGVELFQAGDTLGAIEAWQAAIDTAPDRVDARSNLGAAYARLGRYDQAIEHYRAVLTRVPDQMQVRFNLALALYKAARIAEAHDELQQVVDRDASNKSAVLLLADCWMQMGRDDVVVSLLTPREAAFADDRLFAYLLGTALIRRNELLRGQGYIDRLFRGDETAEGHILLGVAYLQKRDGRAAVPEFEKAVALNPALASAHSLLGRALLELGRRQEAAEAFRKEIAQNPNDFDSNLYLGLLLKDDNQLDDAFEHLSRAGRLRSQDPAVLYGIGALHLAAGRAAEAEQALARVTTQVPDYRQAHVLLATAYYRQKKKALGDEQRAIAEKLAAEQQSREPGAADDLGPAYRGEPNRPPEPKPEPKPKPPGA